MDFETTIPTPPKILIVDPDDADAAGAERIAQDNGWATERATTIYEAIALFEVERFDAVLIDLGLDDVQGHRLIQHMRREDVVTPIVAMTASADSSNIVDALAWGLNGYVEKPLSAEVLTRVLTDVLEGR